MKYILFDLDRTLWDFEGNANITFGNMYKQFDLERICHTDCETFHEYYRIVNNQLWESYRNGTLSKEVLNVQRFIIPLNHFGVTSNAGTLALQLGEYYVHEGPKQTGLMPGARHLLDYLAAKPYTLCIITNGFSEAQVPKMHSSDIYRYFTHFFLSENLGYMKPDVHFFDAVLNQLNAKPEECVVIGDDFNVDILGAHSAGISQIFYNISNFNTPAQKFKPTQEVLHLAEIETIL